MSNLPDSSNASIALPFPESVRIGSASEPSPLEMAVVDLFDQFRNPLLRYVLSFGLTPHDGEEVVQEVFLALFKHLRMGKSRANLRGWIFRVGHNLALKLRIRNSTKNHGPYDEVPVERQLDWRSNPEEELHRIEQRQRLLAAIDVFPEQDRFCLYLRAEGLRYREIAEVLGMSLGSVSISLTRSLGRLIKVDGR